MTQSLRPLSDFQRVNHSRFSSDECTLFSFPFSKFHGRRFPCSTAKIPDFTDLNPDRSQKPLPTIFPSKRPLIGAPDHAVDRATERQTDLNSRPRSKFYCSL
jgi:hypothetical protein